MISLQDEEKKIQFGRYEILAHIATGGMADILLARQQGVAGFEKLVVIKTILPHLAHDTHFVRMFLDEARLSAALNHPNIVQVFDLGKVEGRYFIAMEYLTGENLSEVILAGKKQGCQMPSALAAGIILQACAGLHHAHTRCDAEGNPLHIVHRDINPKNIFILYDGMVKLVDFGIAKASQSTTTTRTGTIKGTIAYMSPEQAEGLELDSRSDIYSLGVVFWELLAGMRLHRQGSDIANLKEILYVDVPDIREVVPEIAPDLAHIVSRALSRNPERRYQTVHDMQEDLRHWLQGQHELWDSIAISRFMNSLFADRIKEKILVIRQTLSPTTVEENSSRIVTALFPASDTRSGNKAPTVSGQIKHDTTTRKIASSTAEAKRKLGRALTVVVLAILVTTGARWLLQLSTSSTIRATTDNEGNSEVNEASRPRHNTIRRPTNSATTQHQSVSTPTSKGRAVPPPIKKTSNQRHEGTPQIPNGHMEPPGHQSRPRKRHRPKTGLLRFATTPWTNVYFRGKNLGQTPLVDVKLPAGRITLTVRNRSQGIYRKISVRIRAGQRVTRRVNLRNTRGVAR